MATKHWHAGTPRVDSAHPAGAEIVLDRCPGQRPRTIITTKLDWATESVKEPRHHASRRIVVDVRRLRVLTIVGPLTYLLLVATLSLLIPASLLGRPPELWLLSVLVVLAAGAVPFSLWVVATVERQQRTLAESAAVLDSVREHAIFMLDARGNILTWNPGAERVKGYTAAEIIGHHVSCFYLPEDIERDRPGRNLRMAAAEGRYEDQGWRVRKDGSRYWADVVSTAVRDGAGNLAGFAQVARDITERRDADEHVRALNDELERRVAELAHANEEIVRRNRQLDAVNTAIVSVSSALDLSEVLQNIVDAARGLVHSRYAALGVVDECGRIVQFITSGMTPEERETIGPLPQGHGLLGTLITDGIPLRIPDIAVDPRRHGFPPNHPPMMSLLGVPILFNGRPVGDLYLTDKDGDSGAVAEFSEGDQDLIMLLANHAAVAIENARLYGEVRVARDRLQAWSAELEDRVAERTREIAGYSKMLTTRVLQAQEEERKRIARELHDDTAQSLSTLLINLDLIAPEVPLGNTVFREGFERVREITQRTLDATRALSHDLRPTILDDFGLVAALHWFADEYTQTFGVPIDVHVAQANDSLTPEMELALFRIAQEALTNSGKYAEATHAYLALTIHDGRARLVVEDRGKGFEPSDRLGPTRQGGLGLYGMQERAELLGGTLEIESTPAHGTRITAIIPLAHAASADVTGRVLAHEGNA